MTTAQLAPPTTAPVTREVTGHLRLTHPTRGYAVTRNPFAISAILPSITVAFAGLAVAMLYITDSYLAGIAVGAFIVVAAGLMLIPAVTLKGSLNLTHDGLTFERGKQHLTAGWDQVTGLVNRWDAGLCLMLRDPQQSTPSIRLPGGFSAQNGVAQIPLRMFGDRQFSILYDIRDRLPDGTWRPALEKASQRSSTRILMVYGGVVAVCGVALFGVMFALTH
jgi:hypothetical protein